MKFDLFKKEDVLRFFRKIDGSIVGITKNGSECPLHTYITSPDGLNINDKYVFVERRHIDIETQSYTIVDFDSDDTSWVNRFIDAIDNAYQSEYGFGIEVTGDQAADILETISEE